MSGHIFSADKYYGFDDALYAAIRMINILTESQKTLPKMRKNYQKLSQLQKLELNDEEEKFAIVESIKLSLKKKMLIFSDIDGIRANASGGWWLIRF